MANESVTAAPVPPIGGAFSDRRVFLCKPDDARLARANWPQTGGHEQAEDGPIYLVIGIETDDNRCALLAERFDLDVGDLILFRESNRSLAEEG